MESVDFSGRCGERFESGGWVNLKPPLSRTALVGVIAAHVGLLAMLWQMTTITKPQAPIVLSVSMIDPAPEPEPELAPAPAPAPTQLKPIVQPPRLVSQSAPKPNDTTVAVTPQESVATPVPVQESPTQMNTTAVSHTPTIANNAAPPAPSPPRFDAAYLDNPKPVYPLISRRMKEEGRVLLRVQVAANGLAADVEIQTSSGSSRLDQSALETVRRWKFVPARLGSEAVAASVLVPVVFSLKE